MAITTKNLNAALGAEVSGIDLSKPVARDDVKTIEDVWGERLVVVFHGQSLSDPQLIAFSKNFGELDPPGPNPYGSRSTRSIRSSTSSPTSSSTASRSAISATAKPFGTPT
jgi:alpha-ketoglutarate-dependent taurine dioxygenase